MKNNNNNNTGEENEKCEIVYNLDDLLNGFKPSSIKGQRRNSKTSPKTGLDILEKFNKKKRRKSKGRMKNKKSSSTSGSRKQKKKKASTRITYKHLVIKGNKLSHPNVSPISLSKVYTFLPKREILKAFKKSIKSHC